MSNGNHSDIYTSRAIKSAATMIGIWLIVAAIVHAIAHPIVESVINRMSMKAYESEMQEQIQNAFNKPAP